MFHGCLARRPYLWDTRENQLSPSYPDSLHSSHVQGICITSQDAYSQATRENTLVFNALSLHTLSFTHTTLTNKSYMKYRVQKIEHNYNQIWHGIKANKTHICKLWLYMLLAHPRQQVISKVKTTTWGALPIINTFGPVSIRKSS